MSLVWGRYPTFSVPRCFQPGPVQPVHVSVHFPSGSEGFFRHTVSGDAGYDRAWWSMRDLCFCVQLALLFIYIRIPETKVLPLELISEVFKISRHEYVQ